MLLFHGLSLDPYAQHSPPRPASGESATYRWSENKSYEKTGQYRDIGVNCTPQEPGLGNREFEHIFICLEQFVVFVLYGIKVVVES